MCGLRPASLAKGNFDYGAMSTAHGSVVMERHERRDLHDDGSGGTHLLCVKLPALEGR
jgi:hypothetical protein